MKIPRTNIFQKTANVGVVIDPLKFNIDVSIRKFRKLIEKHGILDTWKEKQYYEKPSSIKHKLNKSRKKQ